MTQTNNQEPSNKQIYDEVVALRHDFSGDGSEEGMKKSFQYRLIQVEKKIDDICIPINNRQKRKEDNGNKTNIGQFLRTYKWLVTIILTTFTLLIVGWMAAKINWEGVNMLIDTAAKLKPSTTISN